MVVGSKNESVRLDMILHCTLIYSTNAFMLDGVEVLIETFFMEYRGEVIDTNVQK